MYSLPHLHVTGTHYEIGKCVGHEFKHRIKRYLSEFGYFKTKLLPFIKTNEGKKIVNDYLELINEKYPWYVDEMRGISFGSGLDFEWVLALNLRVEILSLTGLIKEKHSDDILKECSDFYLATHDCTFLVHNEDTNEAVYKTGYIVSYKTISVDYDGVKSPEENFTSYCYPAHLPGNAFGFNSSGFCFGVNALYSKHLILKRFPRQIVHRIMYSAKNLKQFEDILLNNPISYGVSLNVGYCGNDSSLLESDWTNEYKNDEISEKKVLAFPCLFNYELAPNQNDPKRSLVSKHCIIQDNDKTKHLDKPFFTKSFYYHVNCYDRIGKHEISMNSDSSMHRMTRINQLKTPENLKEMLDLASDDADSEYPIFRTPRKTDKCLTVATAVFDLRAKRLDIHVVKPNESYKSFLSIPIQ